MSVYTSDDFEETTSAQGPIVEVPSESNFNGSMSAPESDYESPSSPIDDLDLEEEDETPMASARPTSARRKKKGKSRNGRHPVDITPPDKLLKNAERKAKHYTTNNKPSLAIRELIKCTALARIVYGDGHWRLAKSYADLAAGYLDLKSYTLQAQQHSEFAISIMKNNVQLSSSEDDRSTILEVLMSAHCTLGRALAQQTKYKESEKALLQAEKISRERAQLSNTKRSSTNKWNTKIYLAIARLYGRMKKHALSMKYFDRTKDLVEARHGTDSLELIPVYQGMGKVEQSKGRNADHEMAIEYYLQAYSISSATHKEGSIEVADSARALATAYSKVGSDEAEMSAESYLNECLAIYQRIYGPHHEKPIDTENEIARLMIRTDRQEEGVSLLKSSIDNQKEVYGEYSPEVAESWKLIGSVYLSQENPEQALRALKKCHNVECMVYGTNNKKSKDTQRTLDILLANPRLSEKEKNRKKDLNERPRFSTVVSRSGPMGGFKTTTY